jgi:hypothetical protein
LRNGRDRCHLGGYRGHGTVPLFSLIPIASSGHCMDAGWMLTPSSHLIHTHLHGGDQSFLALPTSDYGILQPRWLHSPSRTLNKLSRTCMPRLSHALSRNLLAISQLVQGSVSEVAVWIPDVGAIQAGNLLFCSSPLSATQHPPLHKHDHTDAHYISPPVSLFRRNPSHLRPRIPPSRGPTFTRSLVPSFSLSLNTTARKYEDFDRIHPGRRLLTRRRAVRRSRPNAH